MRSRLAGLLLVAALAGQGAACGPRYRVKTELPAGLQIRAVAVYPFGFRWEEPAWRSYELSARLVSEALLPHPRLPAAVFGPGDFRVWRADDDNSFAASTVAELLPQAGVAPPELVVIRPWAEQRVHSSARTLLDAKGRARGVARAEELTFVGHVEILHPATGARLVEVSGTREVDPFSRADEGGDFDPAPELTALMEGLLRAALRAVDPLLVPASLPAPEQEGFALLTSPWPALLFADAARPSQETRMAKLDSLDRELFLGARARFANPGAEERHLSPLLRGHGGVYVHAAPPGALLQPGDMVLSVNGEPAVRWNLARARRTPGPDRLRVRRPGAGLMDLILP